MKGEHIPKPSSVRELIIRDEKRGIDIEFAELFQQVYGPLTEIITELNRAPTGGWSAAGGPNITAAKRLRQKWESEIEWGRYKGTAVFRNGKVNEVSVHPRTDFDPGLKLPNIIFLQFPDGENAVLREMRMYDPESAAPFLRDGQVSVAAYQRMLDGTFPGFGTEQWETLRNFQDRYFFLPERILVPALESIYKEGFPRVTPRIKLFEGSNGTMHGLRAFHDQLIDLPYSQGAIDMLSGYFGRLVALGLTDLSDTQAAHYVFDGPNIVNIDPDFFRMKAIVNPDARAERRSMVDHELMRLELEHSAEYQSDDEKASSLNLYPHQVDRICKDLFNQYAHLHRFRAPFEQQLMKELRTYATQAGADGINRA